jgi:hypothetical protein
VPEWARAGLTETVDPTPGLLPKKPTEWETRQT